MKRLLILSIIAFFALPNLQAQRLENGERLRKQTTLEERSDRMQARLTEELKLDRNQQKQLQNIATDSKNRAEILKADPNLTNAERRQRLRELRQTQAASIRSMLNAEQADRFDELSAKRKAKAKAYGQQKKAENSSVRADQLTEKMQDKLQLSQRQTEQVRTINRRAAEKRQQIQQQRLPEDAKRTAMQQLREATRSEYAQVLDQQQLSQLKAERKAMTEQRKQNQLRDGTKRGRLAPRR